MKLLERYALASGLKIGKQNLLSKFYPVSCDKYITLMVGSGQAAKNYTFWPEVIALLFPILSEKGISIVQIGRDDPPLLNCTNLLNQTNIHQTNYVLENALAHVGGDSWTSHRAGYLDIPLVEVFGSTSVQNHGPYKYNSNSIFIESHRFGKVPSFQAQEFPKTVDVIPPEQIANSVLKVLKIDFQYNHKSLFIGPFYQQPAIEVVPNCVLSPQFQLPNPPLIRMDYDFNETNLVENLKVRKCIIITDKEIDPNILSTMKPNIAMLRINIENISIDWMRTVKRIGLNINYFTLEKDVQKVHDKRLELVSYCLFDQIEYPRKENLKSGIETYLNEKLPEDFDITQVKFKTNKFLVSDSKIYLSKPHWKAGKSIENTESNKGDVIDSEDFWMDQNHFYIFKG